jgi:hypothetical protein
MKYLDIDDDNNNNNNDDHDNDDNDVLVKKRTNFPAALRYSPKYFFRYSATAAFDLLVWFNMK